MLMCLFPGLLELDKGIKPVQFFFPIIITTALHLLHNNYHHFEGITMMVFHLLDQCLLLS